MADSAHRLAKAHAAEVARVAQGWPGMSDPGLSGRRITSWTGYSSPRPGLPMRVVAIAANARRIWPPGCVRLGQCAISVQRSGISDQIKEKRSQKNGKPRRAWPTACAQHRRGWITKKSPPVLLSSGRAGKWKDRARGGRPSVCLPKSWSRNARQRFSASGGRGMSCKKDSNYSFLCEFSNRLRRLHSGKIASFGKKNLDLPFIKTPLAERMLSLLSIVFPALSIKE